MIENPLVSVCIITFNHQDYIKECIEGALIQNTNFPFEIVIGDDASDDLTESICTSYYEDFPNKIKYFRNEINVGMNRNWVETILRCDGKYIALCEGDDYWTDPFKLQKQVDVLENNFKIIACHHWQKYAVKRNGDYITLKAPIKNVGYLPNIESNVIEIFRNKLRIKTRTIMFRNVIDRDFFPSWFYEVSFVDVPLSFLLGKLGSFGFLDEEMAIYRQTNEGVSTFGLKELGINKFRIQHFKNWIEIWDYANKEFDYKYNSESINSVNEFYKEIISSLPLNLNSFYMVSKFNFFDRDLAAYRSLQNEGFILKTYFNIIVLSLKRKIKGLLR